MSVILFLPTEFDMMDHGNGIDERSVRYPHLLVLDIPTETQEVFFFFFGLDFVGAWSAGLELAVFAFEDVPVRTRMAHRADPLNEGRFRLEEVERVVTVSWDSHCEEASFGEFGMAPE